MLKHIMTKSDCYKSGRYIKPQGIMVHSTGANNPYLHRYVPGVGRYNGNHWDKPGVGACVHAFIGKLDDGTVETVQTLPWNMRGWHAGGQANNTHISFEICEDNLTDRSYFLKCYDQAVKLCCELCKAYQLDPMKPGVLICHCEGHRLGIASNHADVMHWFPKHGKNMDMFRKDVKNAMDGHCDKNNNPAPYAAASWKKAKDLKVMDGSRPHDPLTREQFAVVLDRLGLLKG